jgi:hypothetical protein
LEAICNTSLDETYELPAINFDIDNIPVNWQEGTEDLQGFDKKQLWADLGFED